MIIYVFYFLFFFLVWQMLLVYQKFYAFEFKKWLGTIVVSYIQQYYPNLDNEEKYVLARDIFLEVLQHYKLHILETELDLIIESEVLKLKTVNKKVD